TATLTATCTDKAGNITSRKVTFKYDATAPKLTDVVVTTGNGTATLRWKASPDAKTVTLQRMTGPHGKAVTVYKGDGRSFTHPRLKNGARYRYVLSVTDQAGNVGTAKATAQPQALSSPRQGQTLKKPPLLRWSAVPGADYYNVQLFVGSHKVLTTWPTGT